MDFRQHLLFVQIYIHLCFFVGLFLLPISVSIPVIILCQIIFVGACGTAFFHRTVAHKNKINPFIEKMLILLSWIGASGSAIAWAGTHRMHHRYSDTEKDPHSPQHHGFLKTYWMSSGDRNIMRYVPDLLRNKWMLFQHKNYFKVLLLLHLVTLIIMPLSVYWCVLVVPAFLMWFAGSSINVFCHDNNGPRNIAFLGILHAGEGWHANHHKNGSAEFFNNRFDWGGHIHRLLAYNVDKKA